MLGLCVLPRDQQRLSAGNQRLSCGFCLTKALLRAFRVLVAQIGQGQAAILTDSIMLQVQQRIARVRLEAFQFNSRAPIGSMSGILDKQ